MARTQTLHALAAKAIRKELKEKIPGVKFRVRSESFSMGNAVDVYWNGEGTDEAEISEVISKYQEGHFDGMTDTYEMSNCRDDIPQVKFVHLNLVRD
jgi:glyceraldehyde-3-phosphate dehydrogenase/erythrose-4-phosphate dehydrogenase